MWQGQYIDLKKWPLKNPLYTCNWNYNILLIQTMKDGDCLDPEVILNNNVIIQYTSLVCAKYSISGLFLGL